MDLHFGPKRDEKSVFLVKMKARSSYVGLKVIFIDFITGLCTSCKLYMDLNTSRYLIRLVDLHSRPQKDEKSVFSAKMKTQGQ